MYILKTIENIESFLLKHIGSELVIPSDLKNTITFFHNGDKMIVNTKTGEMEWEPIIPGEIATSKLSMRFHQWFAKGIIKKFNYREITNE